MRKGLFKIDISSSKNDIDKGDLIQINLGSEDIIQVNFSNLIRESKYIRDKYKYSEAINSIQSEIDDIIKKLKINVNSIKLFIQLIQQEKVNVPNEHYKDFYILSEYFDIPKIVQDLDNLCQEDLFDDLDFTIQVFSESKSIESDFETKLTSKIEKFLINRVNECIENPKFGELPVSAIFSIIEKSFNEIIDANLLIDFILESAETRYSLFKFLELHKLTNDKIEKVFKFIEEQEEEKKQIYLEHMPFNFTFIQQMKLNYDKLFKELNQTKEEFKQTKEELDRTQTKLVQTEARLDQCQKELHQKSEEMKHYTKTVMVGGYDKYNQLGGNPNNKNKDGYPVINPPLILSFDNSSILSYSVYGWHSVLVTSGGCLLGTGYNGDHRISPSLPKTGITQFREFSIKDGSGRQLHPLSAVCIGCGTLYMFSKSNGNGRQLVLCDCYINGGNPVFLDVGNKQPVSLFGGYSNAAAIDNEGEVIFINRRSLMQSPESKIMSVSLPGNEKASCVACCDDSVFVLSTKGNLYSSSSVGNGNTALKFSSVSELEGKQIEFLSGTYKHCLAVTKDGRVFGRGSNESGRLGLGKGTWEVSSFNEISSLKGYEIKAAYAGCGHSLFVTKEGKILSCGTNQYGQLLLSSGPGKDVYSPTETTISGGAAFCIAGDCLSAVFLGSSPPPNSPNLRLLKYEFNNK